MASEGASLGEEGLGSAESAQVQHSDQQVDNIAQESHVSGDAADNGTEDGGEYDPESVTTWSPVQPPEQESSASSQRQSKPKMSGGFLVEASDDEDEGPTNDAPNAAAALSHSHPEPSTTSTEVNTSTAPVAYVATPIALNPPITAPVVSSNVTPAVTSLDPVALLEARVKEDPRGDMDAWLNLIADHRRSNRLDQARNAYNRFLEVFPQAVSE